MQNNTNRKIGEIVVTEMCITLMVLTSLNWPVKVEYIHANRKPIHICMPFYMMAIVILALSQLRDIHNRNL